MSARPFSSLSLSLSLSLSPSLLPMLGMWGAVLQLLWLEWPSLLSLPVTLSTVHWVTVHTASSLLGCQSSSGACFFRGLASLGALRGPQNRRSKHIVCTRQFMQAPCCPAVLESTPFLGPAARAQCSCCCSCQLNLACCLRVWSFSWLPGYQASDLDGSWLIVVMGMHDQQGVPFACTAGCETAFAQ